MNSGHGIDTVVVNTSEDALPQRNAIAVSVAEFCSSSGPAMSLCCFLVYHSSDSSEANAAARNNFQ